MGTRRLYDLRRRRRALRVPSDRARLRSRGDRGAAAHGVGHAGVRDRPRRTGLHGVARRRPLRRPLDGPGVPPRCARVARRQGDRLPRLADAGRPPGDPAAARAGRAGRDRARRRALGGDRVRHGLPLRPLARRARDRPDRDRPSRRPCRPPRRRGRAGSRRPPAEAAPPRRLPGRRGARRAPARRPRGPHPADPHRRLPRAPGSLLPDAAGGRADALLPGADGADGRRRAEPLQRRLRARHGVRGGRRAARARTGRGDELLLRRRPRPRRGRLHGRPGLAADRPGEHAPHGGWPSTRAHAGCAASSPRS